MTPFRPATALWDKIAQLRTRRLIKSMGANVYGQVVTFAIQILTVPVFLLTWGPDQYGLWLLITTIPAYLALADMGFSTAAGNDMTMSVARGCHADANRVFNSIAALSLATTTCLGVIGVICILGVPDAWFIKTAFASAADLRTCFLLLLGYSIMALAMSPAAAAFRANGDYAFGVVCYDSIRLCEAAGALLAATAGLGIVSAVVAMTAVRALGAVTVATLLQRRVAWLAFDLRGAALLEIKRLAKPAFAVLAIPMAFAATFQGTVVILGSLLPLSAVAGFTVTRTATRIIIQALGIVTHAVAPEISLSAGAGNSRRFGRLLRLNLIAASVLLVPATALFIIFGHDVLDLWTRGQINVNSGVIAVLSVAAMLQGFWLVGANVLLAVNRHTSYSGWFLAISAAQLLVCYGLTDALGVIGGAWSLCIADTIMAAIVYWRIVKLDVFGVSKALGAP